MISGLFRYLVPVIYPLFPASTGVLTLVLDLDQILKLRSARPFDGTLNIRLRVFEDGQTASEESLDFEVKGGRTGAATITRTLETSKLGYAELHVEADSAVFYKIQSAPGYALLSGRNIGTLTVNADQKFANPRVIDEIKATGRFCMQHSACLVDRARNIGNSLLLINPYEQGLVAQILGPDGKRIRERVSSRYCSLVDLGRVVPDGVWSSYMVTGSNRVLTYDVRHPADRPLSPTSIDHLDVFSGVPTHQRMTLVPAMRRHVRNMLRHAGLAYR